MTIQQIAEIASSGQGIVIGRFLTWEVFKHEKGVYEKVSVALGSSILEFTAWQPKGVTEVSAVARPVYAEASNFGAVVAVCGATVKVERGFLRTAFAKIEMINGNANSFPTPAAGAAGGAGRAAR